MCVSESTWKVLSNGIGFISLRLMKRKWQECKDNYANWQITTTTFYARKLQIAIDLIFSKVPRQIFLPIFNRNTPCNYWPQGTGSRGRQACILITRWHQRCAKVITTSPPCLKRCPDLVLRTCESIWERRWTRKGWRWPAAYSRCNTVVTSNAKPRWLTRSSMVWQ